MSKFGGATAKKALLGIVVAIVAGGVVLGLVSSFVLAPSPYGAEAAGAQNGLFGITSVLNGLSGSASSVFGGNGTQVLGNTGTVYTAVTTVSSTTTTYGGTTPQGPSSNTTQGLPPGSGGLIEFSSQVTLQSASPQQTAS
ncbi:MAG TPA: hypothetical protein VJR06_04475, partial [Nitrososphaerales archaeon]|nr:hypothetical protein [Nitrososphaerales archaeon]